MKPLYWRKLKVNSSLDESSSAVWSRVGRSDLDIPELVKLFSKATITKKETNLKKTKTAKKMKTAKILQTKRSQAVAIFMSSLQVQIEDIKRGVLDVDMSLVDIDTLEAIYELQPQNGEMDKIESHIKQQSKVDEEKKIALDKPEEFLWKLWQTSCFSDRIFCITFTSHFDYDIADLMKLIDIINRTCQVLQSESVVKLFGIILDVGNLLNGGNRTRGGAVGFGLDILAKLKDVKSQNNESNLLVYVVKTYLTSLDDVTSSTSSPLPSLIDLARSSQVRYEDMEKNLSKIKRKLKDCEKKAEIVLKNAPKTSSSSFEDFMQQFHVKATKMLTATGEKLQQSRDRYKATVQYFGTVGKNGEEMSTSDFFGFWIPFCADVHSMWTRQLKKVIDIKKQHALQQLEGKRSANVVIKGQVKPHSLKSRLQHHLLSK